MADFTVIRVEADPLGTIISSCAAGQFGIKYTVLDKTTGVQTVENVCVADTETRPCIPLLELTARGYTPNDWSVECP